MATIVCTSRLREVGPVTPVVFSGGTVVEVLHNAAQSYPRLLNYLLDDQGRVRQHVAIFIDGEMFPRHCVLSQAVTAQSEIYLMQALSGG